MRAWLRPIDEFAGWLMVVPVGLWVVACVSSSVALAEVSVIAASHDSRRSASPDGANLDGVSGVAGSRSRMGASSRSLCENPDRSEHTGHVSGAYTGPWAVAHGNWLGANRSPGDRVTCRELVRGHDPEQSESRERERDRCVL